MAGDLTVLIGGRKAAVLASDRDNRLTLAYDGGYASQPDAVPLSLSLPISDRHYTHDEVDGWLVGLLPDNPSVLARWYERENASPRTPFGLLGTAVGHDCAGAVQFAPAGSEDALEERASGTAPVDDAWLEAEVRRMATESAYDGPEGDNGYYSLGGYQNKTALHRDGGGWARPHGGTPTTHIVKPSPAGREGMAAAEHLCQTAATSLGLGAAATELRMIGPHPTLIATRYDRARTAAGGWERIHQEDMCQALGSHPQRRYQWDGAPGPARIGDLLRGHSTDPAADLRRFRDAILFAWATVNRDAHIRNYSILIRPGTVRLAPLYDLGSALPFATTRTGDLKLAMAVGDDCAVYRSDADNALATLAAVLVLPAGETIEAAERIAAETPAAVRAAMETLPAGAPHDAAELLAARVERRCGNCLEAVAANRARITAIRQTGDGNRASASSDSSAEGGQAAQTCGHPLNDTPDAPRCGQQRPAQIGGRCAAGHERST